MTNLISGKEALIALANGEDVEFDAGIGTWHLAHKGLTLHCFDSYKFRLKPRTITINGIEVPAPFYPNHKEHCFYLDYLENCGFSELYFEKDNSAHPKFIQFGAWRTEDEIKQVVAELRKVFTTE